MKLHILGASSTGVTTLGHALAKQLAIPYFDNDDFFWAPSDIPYTRKADPAIRNSNVKNALSEHKSWVLGGSAINWGQDVFPAFDLIIFLWVPPAIRMERLRQRELQRYGDLIYTDSHRKKLHEDFISWAADYDYNTGIAGRTLQVHEAWLAARTTPVIEIRGEQTTEERLQIVLKKLDEMNRS